MQEYDCKYRNFNEIDTLKDKVSEIPPTFRKELNSIIDLDFVSQSDRIEGIDTFKDIEEFLERPDIRVLHSTSSFGFDKPKEEPDFKIPTDEPYDCYLPEEYLNYLRNTNILVFDPNTNEEHYIETTGHFAAISEMINEARRANRANRKDQNIPLTAEFIADHLNCHILGTKYGRYRSAYYCPIARLNGVDLCLTSGAKVDSELENLLNWYNNESEGLHPIIRAAIFHAEFIRIHPFADGNGRTARLLSNYELVKHGYPTITIKAKNRDEYCAAINKAIKTGDVTNLVDLFSKRMLATENLYINKALENNLSNEEKEL